MNFPNNKYSLYFANEKDANGIAAIFNSGSFEGNMVIRYLRNPNPLKSFAMDGKSAEIICIHDNDNNKLCAVGGAIIRDEYINGEVRSAGYMTGLKILPEYQMKIRFLPQAYAFLYDVIKNKADVFYTTILEDNQYAIKMFEKKHKNMPIYNYMGKITTYCFKSGKVKLPIFLERDIDGFADILCSNYSDFSFVPVDYKLKGFGKKSFYTYHDENGEIIACCIVCDQQESKQYYMCGYNGLLNVFSKLQVNILGYPKFPKAQTYINYCTISYLYIKDNDVNMAAQFLQSVSAKVPFDICLLALHENNPLNEALRKMKAVHYYSRLYQVVWDDKVTDIINPIHVEVALL